MRTFLGTVLSVIAVGVLLIAYGLLSPRAAAAPYGLVTPDSRADAYQLARPMPVNDVISLNDQAAYDRYVASRRALATAPIETVRTARPIRATQTYSAPRRTASSVERAPGRDWKKTALIIGGSTAAGAGVGAIFGGKKGALIGAAIGGGGSTIYEATKRR